MPPRRKKAAPIRSSSPTLTPVRARRVDAALGVAVAAPPPAAGPVGALQPEATEALTAVAHPEATEPPEAKAVPDATEPSTAVAHPEATEVRAAWAHVPEATDV